MIININVISEQPKTIAKYEGCTSKTTFGAAISAKPVCLGCSRAVLAVLLLVKAVAIVVVVGVGVGVGVVVGRVV